MSDKKCLYYENCIFLKNNINNEQQIKISTFNYCFNDFERCAIFMLKKGKNMDCEKHNLHPQDIFNAMQLLNEA